MALHRSAGLQEDLDALAAALGDSAEIWIRADERLVHLAGDELLQLRHLVDLARGVAPALGAAERGPVAAVCCGEEIARLDLPLNPFPAARPPRGRSCACGCNRPVQAATQARYASSACRVAAARQRAAARRAELHEGLPQLVAALRAGGELRAAGRLHRVTAPAGAALAVTATWSRTIGEALASQPEASQLVSLVQDGELLAFLEPATLAALSGPGQGPRDASATP